MPFLLADTEIHAEYEKRAGLDQAGSGMFTSDHDRWQESFSAPEFEVALLFDKRISVGKFQTVTPEGDCY